MALRSGHGNGAGSPRIEVRPADELPEAVAVVTAPAGRRSNGTFETSEAAKAAGRKGGLAKAKRDPVKLAQQLGLGRHLKDLADSKLIAPFVAESEAWYKATCASLARDVGGGQLSPGVTSILRSAAWARAFSNYLYDLGAKKAFAFDVPPDAGDGTKRRPEPRTDVVASAARLADSSRQSYMAAFEIAAREAAARENRKPANGVYDLGAALTAGTDTKA